jgi:putative transposase
VVGVGRPPRHTNSKGTAVKKSSQIQPVGATALPEQVTVAMSEIAENMQEGLLALAVGAGLQVMQALMDADVTEWPEGQAR